MEQETVRITVGLDKEVYARLEEFAKNSGANMISVVVRQAIVLFLSQKCS